MAINTIIPTEVYLPYFTIFTDFVPKGELSDEADAEFDYDAEKRVGTIMILKTLGKKEQLACWAHEMQHALVDYLDILCEQKLAKRSKKQK